MTVTMRTNSSTSAPTLNGAAGSLIAVLDYCLTDATYGVGWSKAYTGSNVAAYRAPSGNRHYLGVDDSTTLNTRMRGFETMTAAGVAVASGTGPFPTDAQQSGGDYFYKSSDTTTARSWLFLSDGKSFYFSCQAGGSVTTQNLMFFGEFESYKSGDAYNTMLMAESSGASYSSGYALGSTAVATQGGHYVARAFTQLGGSTTCGKASDYIRGAGGQMGNNGVAYPAPLEGGLLLGVVLVTEPTGGVRGRMPGFWNILHNKPLTNDDTFSGSGTLTGKSFITRNLATTYQCCLETSNTWYT